MRSPLRVACEQALSTLVVDRLAGLIVDRQMPTRNASGNTGVYTLGNGKAGIGIPSGLSGAFNNSGIAEEVASYSSRDTLLVQTGLQVHCQDQIPRWILADIILVPRLQPLCRDTRWRSRHESPPCPSSRTSQQQRRANEPRLFLLFLSFGNSATPKLCICRPSNPGACGHVPRKSRKLAQQAPVMSRPRWQKRPKAIESASHAHQAKTRSTHGLISA